MPTTAKGTPYVVSTDLVANYPTVSSDLADHIDDNVTYNAQTINAQTGTTYTFALDDATLYKLVTATNAAASTYTVPPQSSVTWVTGAVLRILNQGAGAVTLTPGSGVTLNGASLILSQYQYAELHRTASNAWTVTGIATPPGTILISAQTVSAVSSVIFNNCFTSSYENYRIIVRPTASSGDPILRIRMRVSGTDATGNDYAKVDVISTGSTVTASSATATSLSIGDMTSANPARAAHTFDIFGPQKAADTAFIGTAAWQVGAAKYWYTYTASHDVATAYDGFTLFPSTGTFTGTVSVYAYR